MSKSRLSALAGYRAGFLPNPTLAMEHAKQFISGAPPPGVGPRLKVDCRATDDAPTSTERLRQCSHGGGLMGLLDPKVKRKQSTVWDSFWVAMGATF